MNRTPIAAATLAALLALGACGSDDDDDDAGAAAQGAGDEAGLPGTPGADEGDTSVLNPDLDTGGSVDSEPSGNDTSAIAGLWDTGSGPQTQRNEGYVLISDDGLYTEYDDQQDAVGSGENCYIVRSFRLDREDGDTYSLGDGNNTTLSITPAADEGSLEVAFLDDEGTATGAGVQSWPRVAEGSVDVDSLTACDG